MQRVLHDAERFHHPVGAEHAMRQGCEYMVAQQGHHVLEQARRKRGTVGKQAVGIDAEIRDVVLEGSQADRSVLEKIAFAELEETSERPQQLQAAAHGFARE